MQQFTVRLKNAPGTLATLAESLAEAGVDIRSIGAAVAGTHGYAVFTTNDDAGARAALSRSKYTFLEGEMLLTWVEDRPGSLASVTRALADAGVNIHGVLLLGRREGKAELGLTVDDVSRARRALHLS